MLRKLFNKLKRKIRLGNINLLDLFICKSVVVYFVVFVKRLYVKILWLFFDLVLICLFFSGKI